MDCHFPGPGSLEAPGERALRTRQAHLSRPEVGAGAGVRWDVHGAVRQPGRRDASALSVPARSPIPAAAHTRAPRVHAPPRPPPARGRGRPAVLIQRVCPKPGENRCPGLARGQGAGGRADRQLSGGGGCGKQATAGASRHRGAPGWVMRRASAAPGSARRGPARHASEASVSRAGGLAGELRRKQAPRSRLGALAAQTRSPRELLFSLV